MRKASSKEFDIILNLIKEVNWNHEIVHLDYSELAKKSGTTKKYVKDVIARFTSIHKGKKILTSLNDREHTFKLLLGKSSLFYNEGDTYCKKYSFFYSDKFQSLSIYSKRILLSAAMLNSGTKQTRSYLSLDDFLTKPETSSGLIPNKKILFKTINEINETFESSIQVSLVSSMSNKKEMIYIEFNENILGSVESNQVEKELLRRTLFEYGFFGHLSNEHCIELEKTAKYIFNSFLKLAKNEQSSSNPSIGLVDSTLELARNIYNESTKKLAHALSDNLENFENPKELSAYFSAVVFSTVADEMAKRNHQFESILHLYQNTYLSKDSTEDNEITEKLTRSQTITTILKNWCESWVISRADEKVKGGERKGVVQSLRTHLDTTFRYIENSLVQFGNIAFNQRQTTSFTNRFKEKIVDYLTSYQLRSEQPILFS